MPFKSEFDHKAYWMVLVRGLTGALLGSTPGVVYVVATQATLTNDVFGSQCILIGALAGSMIMGLAAHAGVMNAAIKSRGTGPGKPRTLKDYQQVDALPVIPPASKPAEPPQETVQTRPVETPPPAPPVVETPKVEEAKPAVEEHRPVSFEDFDHQPDVAR